MPHTTWRLVGGPLDGQTVEVDAFENGPVEFEVDGGTARYAWSGVDGGEKFATCEVEPLLSGRWHHGAGFLVCGTVRIAKADFDTNPTEEIKTEVFDWICQTLNRAVGY